MEITDVRVYPVQDEKVQAFVSIVFDRCFMVNDIKIIRGKDGLFVSMPSRKRRSGDFKDVAHPLNTATRRWVEDRILGHFRALSEGLPVPEGDCVGSPTDSGELHPAAERLEPSGSAASTPAAPERAGAEATACESLEEIERRHLGDSFWGVG